MKREKLHKLIQQFQENTISDEDLRELKAFLQQDSSKEMLMEVLDKLQSDIQLLEIDPSQSENMFQRISTDVASESQHRQVRPLFRRDLRKWALVGAALLLCVLSVVFYSRFTRTHVDGAAPKMASTPIVPGGSKAKVLLEDGSTIDLESLSNDTTIMLNGYSIHKDANGLLSYEMLDTAPTDQIRYNTIITPQNGEYSLMLADGTKIWVNSGSELRYPLNFGDSSRTVHLQGEAYFEVATLKSKQRNIPFIVHTGEQQLKVLGTSFNINSKQGKIETTLVEGAVQLSFDQGEKHVLKPNQQAVFSVVERQLHINEVDPFYTIAWKNGVFAFDNISVKDVMNILSAWYDVEVDYQDDVSKVFFTGTVSRYEEIQKVLQLIEITGSVRFKTAERRIVVMH